MRIITGKVVDGRVELPPDALEEGASVTILAGDSDEPVVLSRDEERELTEAVEAIARGHYVDGDQLLARIRSRRAG